MLPNANYLRALQNVYLPELSELLYGCPRTGLQILEKHDIEYVLIDFTRLLVITAQAPLFTPESLAANFKLVAFIGAAHLFSTREGESLSRDTYLPLLENYALFRGNKANYMTDSRLLRDHVDLYAYGKTIVSEQTGP